VKAKPITPRVLANRDVDEAFKHYQDQDAAPSALALIDAQEQAYAHVGKHGATGSTRYAHELNLPGLHFWPLTRYPYLVLYVEQVVHIDVWRVLHSQRDIPTRLRQPDES
jgi:toxin ParE1/3/4